MKQIIFVVLFALLASFSYFWYIGEYAFILAPVEFFIFSLTTLHYSKVWQFVILSLPILTVAGFLAGRNMIVGSGIILVAGASALGFTSVFTVYKLLFSKVFAKVSPKVNLIVSGIVFGLLVVSLEYLFGIINPFGAWTSSGYVLFPILEYLNWLPVFGSFGVYFYSFLYAIFSYFVFMLIANFDNKDKRALLAKFLVGIILIGFIIPAFLIFSDDNKNKNKNLRVGLVNSQTSAGDNMYNKLDRIQVIADNSDIVLTGEAFFRFNDPEQQLEAFGRLSRTAIETNSYIFVGLISIGENLQYDRSNKLVGWSPKGEIIMNYTKAKLLPDEVNIYNQGESQIPFVDTEFGRIGGVICFDSDHPEYIAQSKSLSLDYLLVPVKEWSGIARRHTQQIAFRAKENKITVINSAVNGTNRITDYDGKEIFSSRAKVDGESDIVVEIKK